jgi:hypothetical protein
VRRVFMRFWILAALLFALSVTTACGGDGGGGDGSGISNTRSASVGQDGQVAAVENVDSRECLPDDPANDDLAGDFLQIGLVMNAIDFEGAINTLHLGDYDRINSNDRYHSWGWNSRVDLAERNSSPFALLRTLREFRVYGEWHDFGRHYEGLTQFHQLFFPTGACAELYFESQIEGEEVATTTKIGEFPVRERTTQRQAALLIREIYPGGVVIRLKGGEGIEGLSSSLQKDAQELALEYWEEVSPLK